MTKQIALLFALILALAALAVGCSDDPASPAEGDGYLRVNLVDGPGDYQAVLVEVLGVSVHLADEDSTGGWRVVSTDSAVYDLLSLRNGAMAAIADSALPAGDYTQIRLHLGDGNRVVVDGDTLALTVPSGQQSGLKLNHPFTIEPGALYEITLDFDAARSVHRTGNGRYMLKPVIRAQAHVTSGSIVGVVDPAEARARVWTVAGADTVTAHADTLTGSFALMALPAGGYDLRVEPTAGAFEDSLLAGVLVTAGQMTDVGTIALEAVAAP